MSSSRTLPAILSTIRRALLVIAAVTPASLQAQDLMRELVGTSPGYLFGYQIAAGGDVDGDGTADLLVSTTTDYFGLPFLSVQVYSGHSGTLLRTHFDPNTESFGAATAFIDDVDGDGVADYAIFDAFNFLRMCAVSIYSGSSGNRLHHVPLTLDALYAPHIRSLHDVDGDGAGDFVVADAFPANEGGDADVVSGASGAILYTLTERTGYFARTSSSVPDQDGDGVDDLAIASPLAHGSQQGSVLLYSGRAGTFLRSIDGPTDETFGWSIARIADVNGDGIDELAVGAPNADGKAPASGAVYVHSGADWSVLFRLDGEVTLSSFGDDVVDAGDVNGDGVQDLAVRASPDRVAGAAFLFSGRTGGRLYRFDFGSDMVWGNDNLAAMGDLDGDGADELAVGNQGFFSVVPGRVWFFGGNDLYLLATPHTPHPGDLLTLETREGEPTQLALNVLVDVNGAPTFLPVGGIGSFDATGKRLRSGSIPPGLAGNVIKLQSYAQGGRGVRTSGIETITFQ